MHGVASGSDLLKQRIRFPETTQSFSEYFAPLSKNELFSLKVHVPLLDGFVAQGSKQDDTKIVSVCKQSQKT